jgi:hypothetical protein
VPKHKTKNQEKGKIEGNISKINFFLEGAGSDVSKSVRLEDIDKDRTAGIHTFVDGEKVCSHPLIYFYSLKVNLR